MKLKKHVFRTAYVLIQIKNCMLHANLLAIALLFQTESLIFCSNKNEL